MSNENRSGPTPAEQGFRHLSVPVPPQVEETLGYAGQARFVAFYWEPVGDELTFDDGRVSVTGAQWYAWMLFVQHKAVAPHLSGLHLGSSEESAREALLFDRQERAFYAAARGKVLAFVHGQHPVMLTPQEAVPSEPDTYGDVLSSMNWAEFNAPELLDIRDQMNRQNEGEDEMVRWLDEWLRVHPTT